VPDDIRQRWRPHIADTLNPVAAKGFILLRPVEAARFSLHADALALECGAQLLDGNQGRIMHSQPIILSAGIRRDAAKCMQYRFTGRAKKADVGRCRCAQGAQLVVDLRCRKR
jgi:hypothetical protein